MNKSNNQRANAKNPNNPAYKANRDNSSNQLNPNNPAYDSSREEELGKVEKKKVEVKEESDEEEE